jgi:prolyl-tRNA synthetase
VPINYHKSSAVQATADRLYGEFQAAGVDVLLDDRDARPGVKFADSELLGIPHRIVIGERGLAAGALEYRSRQDSQSSDIAIAEAVQIIQKKRTD